MHTISFAVSRKATLANSNHIQLEVSEPDLQKLRTSCKFKMKLSDAAVVMQCANIGSRQC